MEIDFIQLPKPSFTSQLGYTWNVAKVPWSCRLETSSALLTTVVKKASCMYWGYNLITPAETVSFYTCIVKTIFFLTKHCTDYSVHFHNVLSSRVNHTLNKTAMMHLYPCLVQCQLANRMLSWCAISAERVSSWCGFILQALNLLQYIDGLCLVALPAGDGYVYVWVGILLIGKQRDKGKKKKKGPTSSCLWFQAGLLIPA